MKFKKYLQPNVNNETIIFGGFQEGISRSIYFSSITEAEKNFEIIYKVIMADENIEEYFEEKEIQIFKNAGLLIDDIQYDEKYSRNINLFGWLDKSSNTDPTIYQKLISEKKVLIIGLGAIGTNVATHLIQLGVKNFIIVDSDVVEISNLTRQVIYKENDIGKFKVDVVEKFLKDMDKEVQVEKIMTFIENEKDIEKCLKENDKIDILIGCGDQPSIKINKIYSNYAFKNNIPYVMGTYASTIVNAAIFIPGVTLTFEEMYIKHCGSNIGGPVDLNELYEYETVTAATSPVAALCASLISIYIQFYFTGLANCMYEYYLTEIDYFNMKMTYYDIRK